MKKKELIEIARQMMVAAYNETDNGGYDEWDQTFIELLKDKLIYHLDIDGIKLIIKDIETNSLFGLKQDKLKIK